MLSRRAALTASFLAVPMLASSRAQAWTLAVEGARARLAKLEQMSGGRLGAAILNIASGARAGHREDERFLLCSTFKALAAAFVLARVDRMEEQFDRRIIFSEQDLVVGSPVTKARVGRTGMTIAELCEAAVTRSDNTAGNLLLTSFGGPAALTSYARSLGDTVTRLDRIEPELNEHDGPDDQRDTTSASAMLDTLQKLLFGGVLSKSSRAQFAVWLIANKTGDRRLRAGFPEDWLVGDKTGTNGSGNANDVGVGWPPSGGAVIVTAYYRDRSGSDDPRNAVLAEVGRIAAQL